MNVGKKTPWRRRSVAGPTCLTLGLALHAALACGASASEAELTPPAIDPQRATACFQEMQTISAADGGRLWGVTLYGPTIFVDVATRAVAANHADAEHKLRAADGLYIGTLPPDAAIANTAVDWAGVHWTMMLWPLPKDATDRRVLMAHESWHRIQDSLGLPMSGQPCFHLDTLEGRYWLQMEWRALRAALLTTGDARQPPVADALLFRAHRRGLFAGAALRECDLEMNEGLAEYTGIRAAQAADSAACRSAAAEIERAARKDAFARSFAYASGPAYGLLLDAASPAWRASAKFSRDLGALLQSTMQMPAPADDRGRVRQRAALYDPDGSLRQAELAREEQRLRRIVAYKHDFVDGPIFDIPLQSARFSFDPNQVFPFEERGTVYGVLSIHDAWGTLEAEQGAFVSADFKHLVVPVPAAPAPNAGAEAPATPPLTGAGWKLTLAAGWKIVPGARPGDFTLAAGR